MLFKMRKAEPFKLTSTSTSPSLMLVLEVDSFLEEDNTVLVVWHLRLDAPANHRPYSHRSNDTKYSLLIGMGNDSKRDVVYEGIIPPFALPDFRNTIASGSLRLAHGKDEEQRLVLEARAEHPGFGKAHIYTIQALQRSRYPLLYKMVRGSEYHVELPRLGERNMKSILPTTEIDEAVCRELETLREEKKISSWGFVSNGCWSYTASGVRPLHDIL